MRAIDKGRRFVRRQAYRMGWLAGREVPEKIVFLHTVKTGGTSINSYFKDYVGSSRSGRMVRFDDFLQQEDFDVLLERARKAKYVGGHLSWATFERFKTEDTFSFTIFREPYDRLRSLYHYFMNIPGGYRGASEIADIKGMSLPEFLTSDHKWIRFHTDNFIARQFAGPLNAFPIGHDERMQFAERAIRNLSSISYRGFHDDFETAFADIVRLSGLPVPETSPKINVTSSHIETSKARQKAGEAFDEEMRELARPRVEADIEVYNHFLREREHSTLG